MLAVPCDSSTAQSTLPASAAQQGAAAAEPLGAEMREKKRFFLAVTYLALAACAPRASTTPYQRPAADQLPLAVQECMGHPATDEYLRALHKEVIDRWKLPSRSHPNQTVTIEFRLLPNGEVADPTVVNPSDSRFADSALEAIRASSPFPPLPDAVQCLAGARLRLGFRNPEGAR